MGLQDRRESYSKLLEKVSQIQILTEQLIEDISESSEAMIDRFSKHKKSSQDNKVEWETFLDLVRDLDTELNILEP